MTKRKRMRENRGGRMKNKIDELKKGKCWFKKNWIKKIK